MLTTDEVERLNQSLLFKFGRLWDKPKYRLSYTNDCFEERYVEGKEFFGPVFLRDVKGIKEMPKYPRDRDRYVLEILVQVPPELKEELVASLSYEPLHIFKVGDEYREPNWFFINMLAMFSHHPLKEAIINVWEEMRKLDERDYQTSLDILNNELPDMAIALRRGSASFIDATKVFKG